MKFLANHTFSGYFLALNMAIVLSIAPIQNISAAVSSCMQMGNSAHHQMNASSHNATITNMAGTNQTDNSHDCCDKNKCQSTHCSGATTAVISSNTIIHYNYVDNSVYQAPGVSLTHVYPSSLYRPPKI